jgi:hypothetical protein
MDLKKSQSGGDQANTRTMGFSLGLNRALSPQNIKIVSRRPAFYP